MTQAPHLQDRAKPPMDSGGDRIASERRPTYGQIQAYCRRTYGFTPQTCWIADVLSELGLTRRQAPNRKDPLALRKPCPPGHRDQTVQAMQSLGLISDHIPGAGSARPRLGATPSQPAQGQRAVAAGPLVALSGSNLRRQGAAVMPSAVAARR